MEEKPRILIIFAHPNFENSRVNRALINVASQIEGVYIHDLYEIYPDFNIDVAFEQRLLLQHDVIILQHPFYWYSCPPIVKQWIDLVLEFGWAYGKDGNKLKGKVLFNSITAGGRKSAYSSEGQNSYTVSEFLRPFEQTAILCSMRYLKPFVVYGSHSLMDQDESVVLKAYQKLLLNLQTKQIQETDPTSYTELNELCLQ